MNVEWPPSIEAQSAAQRLGFAWYGHHGRFAFAYKQRGQVAIVEHFVLHPRLRNGRYVRLAFDAGADFLRSRGVKYVVGVAISRNAPFWRRRLGMQEPEPGLLRVRIG